MPTFVQFKTWNDRKMFIYREIICFEVTFSLSLLLLLMKHLIKDDDGDRRVTNKFAYLTMEKIVFNPLHGHFLLFAHFAVILVHPTKRNYLFFNPIGDASI